MQSSVRSGVNGDPYDERFTSVHADILAHQIHQPKSVRMSGPKGEGQSFLEATGNLTPAIALCTFTEGHPLVEWSTHPRLAGHTTFGRTQCSG